MRRKLFAQFQVRRYLHRLDDAQIRTQQILLHNVTGQLIEQVQITRLSVGQNRTADSARPAIISRVVGEISEDEESEPRTEIYSSASYTYPIRIFISVVFPAPEGPMMAESFPDSNDPLMLFNIVFVPVKKKKIKLVLVYLYLGLIQHWFLKEVR